MIDIISLGSLVAFLIAVSLECSVAGLILLAVAVGVRFLV